jgi:phosphate transport system substrate-binding protein
MTSRFIGLACLKALAPITFIGINAVFSIASATNTLVGGGATAPTLGLVGDVAHRLQSPGPTSLFGVYSAQTGSPQISYCMTGSGMGKSIFTGSAPGTGPVNVQLPCPDGNTDPRGFGAATVGRTDLMWPSFVESDVPLTSTDYGNYLANHASSRPVQFPMLAASIAITFNKANVTSLALTDAQVCKLFSGQITDWSDPQLAAAGVPAGVSGPISIVYDSDGSGTTFGLSNHLAAVCAGTPSQHFIADPYFPRAVQLYFPGTSPQTSIPTRWIAQSGDPSVANTVLNTDGTIGYAGAADVINILGMWATINGLDPIADFGDASGGTFTLNPTDWFFNQALNGADPVTGQPVIAPISPAPSTQCIALVKPQAYANPPSSSSSRYPIVSISYFLANSGSNAADASNIRNLLWAPYNTSIANSPNLANIGPGTGLAFLKTSFTQWQISGCIAN